MSMPGFRYDPKTKKAKFSIYIPGGKGKVRRKKTVQVKDIAHARREWAQFVEEQTAAFQHHTAPVDASLPVIAFLARESERMMQRCRERTKIIYRSLISTHIQPSFGEFPLSAFTVPLIEDYQQELLETGLSPASVNNVCRMLRMLLRHAVKRGYLTSYPLNGLQLLKVQLPENELSDDEYDRLIAAFRDWGGFQRYLEATQPKGKRVTLDDPGAAPASLGRVRRYGHGYRSDSAAARRYFERFSSVQPLFIVAVETGLRKGDLTSLAWAHVDMDTRWIVRPQQKTTTAVGIPITDRCLAALTALRSRPVVSARVFVNAKGKQVSECTLRRYFKIAKAMAGITRRVRFHDLRHTCGSRLVSKGVPIEHVSAVLGHSTIAMTQRYARPTKESVKQSVLSAL